METVNYEGRTFASVSNSTNGEVGDETRFHYHQEGSYIWATYSGGEVTLGQLLGRVEESGLLLFNYHHYNSKGVYRSGSCRATPEILPDNRIRLNEQWQWTNGDRSTGTSVVEEVSPHTGGGSTG